MDQRHLTSAVGLYGDIWSESYGEVMICLYNRDNILNYKSIECEIRVRRLMNYAKTNKQKREREKERELLSRLLGTEQIIQE